MTRREFSPGDHAVYRGAWGTEPPLRCTITAIDEKRVRRIYVCTIDGKTGLDANRWGYDDQFQPAKS